MSFDWLNVPGLRVDSDSHASVTNSPPLPNVSFKFGDESIAVNDYNHTIKETSLSNEQHQTNHDVSKPRQGQINPPETLRTHEHGVNNADRNTMSSYKHSSKTDSDTSAEYSESLEDVRIPLSLSSSSLDQQEFKAYRRWYNYMAFRRNPQAVRLEDIFGFLINFHLTPQIKERTKCIFRTCQMSVSMGEFFAVMRIISHALHNGQLPTRKMIVERAPVPHPKSILSTETGQEIYEEVEADPKSELDNKVDFDSFASLLLTGQKVRKNIRRKVTKRSGKVKKVAFSENIATFHEEFKNTGEESAPSSGTVNEIDEENAPMDFSLPMDQLLKKMAERKRTNSALVSNPTTQPESAEEMEELADMRDSLSHFKQIQTGDNVNLSNLTNKYMTYMAGSTDSSSQGNDSIMQPLQPTATGSANHLFRSHLPPQINTTPNGPIQNPPQQILEPLKPTATGSANRLFRSHMASLSSTGMGPNIEKHATSTQQPAQQMDLLQPTATGSANYLMKQHFVANTQEKANLGAASTPALHGQSTNYIPSSSPVPLPPNVHNISDMSHSPQLTQNQISPFTGSANGYTLPYHQQGTLSVSDTELSKYYNPMYGSSPAQLTPEHTPQIPYRPPVQTNPYLMVPPQSQYMNMNMQNIPSVASDSQLFHNDPYPASTTRFSQSPHQLQTQQPPSRDILGDLRALQHQVNQMQHSYARR